MSGSRLFGGRYILFCVSLLISWPEPLTGRDGAHLLSPDSCAPRMNERPVPARGGEEAGTGAFASTRVGTCIRGGITVDLVLVRLLFVIVITITCYVIEPFGLPQKMDAGVGALVGAAIVLFEWQLRRVSLKRLIGAAAGSILGICGAYLFSLVIRNSVSAGNTQSFLQILVMLLMAYVGLIVGASKGDL